MKYWWLAITVLIVAFLVWGYMSGHCTLCKGIRDAISPTSTPGSPAAA